MTVSSVFRQICSTHTPRCSPVGGHYRSVDPHEMLDGDVRQCYVYRAVLLPVPGEVLGQCWSEFTPLDYGGDFHL